VERVQLPPVNIIPFSIKQSGSVHFDSLSFSLAFASSLMLKFHGTNVFILSVTHTQRDNWNVSPSGGVERQWVILMSTLT
jgi:hypothetical protein